MITAQLVDRGPYYLRYLLTQDGESVQSPTLDSLLVIPNNAGVTPDLRTDSAGQFQIQRIMRARIDGYPTPAGAAVVAGVALTQAQARALLDCRDPTQATLTDNVLGCKMYVDGRSTTGSNGAQEWTVDAAVDVSGDPVVQVRTLGTVRAGTAVLEIKMQHSYDGA